MRRASSALVVALVVTVSCSELFDEAVQCKSDRDCRKFAEATCDLARSICVPRAESSLDAGGGPTDDGAPPPADAATDTGLPDPLCAVSPKPTADVQGTAIGDDLELAGTVTLDCTKDWILRKRIFVASGATLIIQPGTTIRAQKGANAAIVVRPGGRITAQGQRDRPIVLTVDDAAPQPNDWRGLLVLGAAPPTGQIGGDAALAWGGTDPMSSSGALEFVRVEYAAGLVLAGVGKGTKVDHVEVRRSGDNCFSILGGRVDAKHLVCQYPADEMLEISNGYEGKLQFLFGQRTPTTGGGHNGLLVETNGFATIYNATLCGADAANQGYGLVFRNNGRLDLGNAILSGWLAGLDVVGNRGNPFEVRGSIAFGNATNPAYVENQNMDMNAPTFDDDAAFDEVAFFGDAARGNRTADPALAACFDPKDPKPWPNAAITNGARTPPNDGFFDANAGYVGAFRDANDAWMKGAWVRFDDK